MSASSSSSSSVKHSHVILEDFHRKVTEYYETKKQFEDEINQILENKRVRGQKLDRKERKTVKIGKCVVCRFPGMTFTNTKEELRIQCNTNPNCRANQVIRKPVFENVETQMNDAKQAVDDVKEEIIHLKLNLLFGYASDDETVGAFNKLQVHMKKAFESYDRIRLQYYDIVSNSGKLKQLQDIDKSISEIINEIKANLSPVDAIDVTQDVVRDTVKLYRERLITMLRLQEQIKYSVSEVVTDEDYSDHKSAWRKRVNRIPISLGDLVLPVSIN
jgi:hypothetical protein